MKTCYKILGLMVLSGGLMLADNQDRRKELAKKLQATKCDVAKYIVVGAGNSGSALAKYLSDADPKDGKFKNSVLVLTDGTNMQHDEVVRSGSFQYADNQGALTYDTKYARTDRVFDAINGPILALGYQNGKNWGGNGGTNQMLHTRGHPAFYNSLAKASGNNRWLYKNVLPLLKFQEHFYPFPRNAPVSPSRGTHGPLNIIQYAQPNPKNRYIKALSEVLGSPVVTDIDTVSIGIGSGQFYNEPKTFDRSYGVTAFLNPKVVTPDGKGVGGRKLKITSAARVNNLILDGDKAVGVTYIDSKGKTHSAYASHGVILCAGIPYSAAILQRSGIGDPKVLKPLKIPVIKSLPHVGMHFKRIYGVMGSATGKIPEVLTDFEALYDGRPYYPADGQRRFLMLFDNFITLDYEIQTALGVLGQPGISFYCYNLQPSSEGTAFIEGKFLRPSLHYDLYSTQKDFDAAVAMYKLMRDYVDKLGYQMIYPYDFRDQALAIVAKAILVRDVYTVSPYRSGTCNMGTSAKNSVVDGNLRVHGMKNLMVADTSVLINPEPPFGTVSAYLIGAMAAKSLGVRFPIPPSE